MLCFIQHVSLHMYICNHLNCSCSSQSRLLCKPTRGSSYLKRLHSKDAQKDSDFCALGPNTFLVCSGIALLRAIILFHFLISTLWPSTVSQVQIKYLCGPWLNPLYPHVLNYCFHTQHCLFPRIPYLQHPQTLHLYFRGWLQRESELIFRRD